MDNQENEPELFIGAQHPDIPDWLRPHIQKYTDALNRETQINSGLIAQLQFLEQLTNQMDLPPDPAWAYTGIWDAVRRVKTKLQQTETLLRQTEEWSPETNQQLRELLLEAVSFAQVVLALLTPRS